MALLEFIFRDFWHFVGTIILLAIAAECIVCVVRAGWGK